MNDTLLAAARALVERYKQGPLSDEPLDRDVYPLLNALESAVDDITAQIQANAQSDFT